MFPSTPQQPVSRLIVLQEVITKDSVKPIIERILLINKEDEQKEKDLKNHTRDPIEIHMDCPGGSVPSGLALVSVIEQSKTPIHTIVHGLAMSMGLLIAACGHRRFATRTGMYMEHSISAGPYGKIEELNNHVDYLGKVQRLYYEILCDKSKGKLTYNIVQQKKRESMNNDWYFWREEALKYGLVDEFI